MEACEIQTPVLSPGARVEVDYGAGVLVCRLATWHRTTLHLSVPPGARRALQLREGGLIRLTLYPPPDRRQATDHGSGVGGQGSGAGPAKSKASPPLPFLTPDPSPLTPDLSPVACLESGACMRGWVWTRPPLLVVAPLGTWREKWRRTAPRAPRQLAARLVLAPGTEYVGRTQDVSAGGVSMMVAGLAEIREGTSGWLTIEIEEGHWSEDLPVRITRARHWLRRAGRTMEVGAEFRMRTDRQCAHWHQCLARLGVEE